MARVRVRGPRTRVDALDALRGFALCGILLVNIPWQIITVHMEYGSPGARLLELTVHGRFFPIFSFLFGVSFALFLDSAANRTAYPRLILLRRLAALALVGLAHVVLHPGEALLPYAVIGIVVLLPASWLPRPIVLVLAGLALAGGVMVGGGVLLIPGLFLIGLAAVRYGVIDTLAQRRAQLAILCGVSTLGAVAATVWQYRMPADDVAATTAGLIGAIAYGTALLLFLRTRPGAGAQRVLAPLGRMALTNYLSATLIAAVAGPLIGLTGSAHYGRMALLALAILVVQAVASRYWLARHRYGPAEWLWRAVTWWSIPRRESEKPADPRPTAR
ncbi:DUF418 domain-containing protein [Catenuloplanes japonicus]|uniref:DUF418 domain-containing protein n=1 Tax=Catenuloplanes japonicus TaxID=33876 RepID=UPI000524256C|nr:DUF418 domain-containing protein [Catenuloplanes japonicus]